MSNPARLPNDAPKALREFVACRTTSVTLDGDSLDWLPRPPGMSDSPVKVTVKDGSTSTTATLEVGFGEYISMDLPVSIGANGELQVAASDIPLGIGPRIDAWVADFNETLKANGKRLEGFSTADGSFSITKTSLATPKTPVTELPRVAKPLPAVQPSASLKQDDPGGLSKWLIAAALAILAGGGAAIFAATSDGGSAQETADSIATERADEAVVEPPPSEPPPPTDAVTAEPDPDPDPVDQERDAEPDIEVPDDPIVPPNCGLVSASFNPDPAQDPWSSLSEWVGGGADCDPSGGYGDCNADALPCWDGTMPPFVIPSLNAGWNHSKQINDAVTGAESYSVSLQQIWLVGPFGIYTHVVVQNDCGGQTVTSETPIDGDTSGGVFVEVTGPLFSFGSCGPPIYSFDGGPDMPAVHVPGPADSGFVVDASQPASEPPIIDGFAQTSDQFDPSVPYLDNVNVIHNVIGAQPNLDDGCIFLLPPDNVDQVIRVLDQCPNSGHFWVFAAGLTPVEFQFHVTDQVAATTGAYVNPIGDPGAGPDQLVGFDASTDLFDNTIFPCGPGHVAVTVCPADPAPVDAGGYVAVSGAFLDAVPLVADGTDRSHSVDFSGVGGQTYTASQTDDGWTLETSDGSARARALLRDDSLTFMIPRDELPAGGLSYQWSTTVDGNTHAQPVVPVMGVITTPTVLRAADEPEPPTDPTSDDAGPSEPGESLESFYEQLSASVATGDVGFAFDRLHPTVFDAYPTECPAALESFADPDLVIEFVADNGPEPWTWELSDGRSFDVPDAVNVTLRLSGRGQEGTESSAHVAVIDGEYRWFTFCGDQ